MKSADVLAPGAHLVVLATPLVVPDDAARFWWDVQDDHVAEGAVRVDPATKPPGRVGDIGAAASEWALFEERATRRHRFDVTFSADDYALNLSTQSFVRQAPAGGGPGRADGPGQTPGAGGGRHGDRAPARRVDGGEAPCRGRAQLTLRFRS